MKKQFNKGLMMAFAFIAIIVSTILEGCNKSSSLELSQVILSSYPVHQKTDQEKSALLEFAKSSDFKREFTDDDKNF